MRKLIAFAALVSLFLAACSDETFVSIEQAADAHRYYLADEYAPDYTLEDIVWQITSSRGDACNLEFCYSYQGVLFTIGDPAGVHVSRQDYFIWKDGDGAGWRYADWL